MPWHNTPKPLHSDSLLDRHWLIEWNDTAEQLPPDSCIHELFEYQASRTPHATAVLYRNEPLTYSALNLRSNQLSYYLRSFGVGPEVRVAVLMDRSVDLVVSILGILKAGGAYVGLDRSFPSPRIAQLIDDANVSVVITTEDLLDHLPSVWAPTINLSHITEDLRQSSTANPVNLSCPENLAYISCTSGSTGDPKGAAITHKNVVCLIHALDHIILDARTILNAAPLAFDASTFELWGALLRGRTCALLEGQIPTLADLRTILRVSHVDTAWLTSSLFNLVVDEDLEILSPVQQLLIGGERLSAPHVLKFRQRFPGTLLLNGYGPTESTTFTSTHRISDDSTQGAIPIGRPIGNTRLYIVNSDLEPLTPGLPGEVMIAGMGLSRGYLNLPNLTAERFLPDAFAAQPGGRIYRSGDFARYREDGCVEFLGRLDRQAKVRGHRIDLGAVEEAIREHPGVADAVVEVQHGATSAQVVAWFVPDITTAGPVRCLAKMEKRCSEGDLFELPNGLVIAHLNRSETSFLYFEHFSRMTYLRHRLDLGKDAVVFDVGANIGLFALSLAFFFPDAKVFCFEPIPDVYRRLELNASLFPGKIIAFPFGIAKKSGAESFTWYPNGSIFSGQYANTQDQARAAGTYFSNEMARLGHRVNVSRLEELYRTRLRSTQVECTVRTLSDILRATGVEFIDLLKIDVEKGEMDVLQGIECTDWERIGQLVIEVHGRESLKGVSGLLKEVGFDIEVTQDAWLAGTNLACVFATRKKPDKTTGQSIHPSSPKEHEWHSPGALIADLREYLEQRFPRAMVPSLFTYIDSFPLKPSGKIDRGALVLVRAKPLETTNEVAPRNHMEVYLSQVWKTVLNKETVGVTDDFFALGGDSLLALQLLDRVERDLSEQIEMSLFFEAATIEHLAAMIGGASASYDGPSSVAGV